MTNPSQKIRSAAEAAAIDWFRRQCADSSVRMHLHYKPGEIAFWIGPNPLSDEWIQDIPITADLTRTKAVERIVERAAALPLIADGGRA